MENSSVNPMQQRAGDDVSDEVKPRGPSLAYMKSMKQSEFRKADLESKGIGALDFEYRDTMAEEEGDERVFSSSYKNSTTVTPYQRVKKIGRKTTCMALCLTAFGLGMVITSFFYLRDVSTNGFYLFLLIGICSLIPGTYATYNIIGKYNGWKGFETGLPSYDRRAG